MAGCGDGSREKTSGGHGGVTGEQRGAEVRIKGVRRGVRVTSRGERGEG